MKPTVYIETTIVSYLAAHPSQNTIAAGHQAATHLWWEFCKGAYDLYSSTLVTDEAGAGDAEAASRRLTFLNALPVLAITQEAKDMASEILKQKIIPQGYAEDALHIGICAAHSMDFLLTWNCRHLANALVRKRLEKTIQNQGFFCPVICTPEELMENQNV